PRPRPGGKEARAEGGGGKKKDNHRQQHGRDPNQIMDAEEAVRAEGDEFGGQTSLAAHRRAAGDEKNDPAYEDHGAQRGDEGIDVEERDNETVREPDGGAGDDPGRDPGRDPGLES